MDATTMQSTRLLKQITIDFSQFSYVESDVFQWSAESRTIHIDSHATDALPFTLHELGHALLDHRSYVRDIDLLKMERDAWHVAATQLSQKYRIMIDETLIQDNLDTYREWLHRRSLCPSCRMTGLQASHDAYLCLACGCRWKSNEARNCALRRTIIAH